MSSMTPIKVRGKRQTGKRHSLDVLLNPQPHSEPPPSSASGRRLPTSPGISRALSIASECPRPAKKFCHSTSSDTSTPVTARHTSLLEQLPIELLEEIFFLCLNVSLPQASLAIGQKLASYRVKRQLVFRVLSSASSTEYPCALAAVFPTLREQSGVQSTILGLRWMTLEFLREIIPDFIVRTIMRELGPRNLRRMGDGPVRSTAIEAQVRQFIEDNDYRRNEIPIQGLPAYWEINFPITDHIPHSAARRLVQNALHGMSSTENDANMSNAFMGVGLRDGLVTLGGPCHGKATLHTMPQYMTRHMRWRMLCCVEGCRLPEKLLHGPWTDDKCEFLEILIRGNATVDWIHTTSGEVAKQGLLQALRECNSRAVKLLLSRPSNGSAMPSENCLTKFFVDKAARTEGQLTLSSFRDEPMRRGVAIVPEYEHLRIAVLEEGCDQDIVHAILDAPGSFIDLEGTEVFHWALMESLRGNERAKWLWQRFRPKELIARLNTLYGDSLHNS